MALAPLNLGTGSAAVVTSPTAAQKADLIPCGVFDLSLLNGLLKLLGGRIDELDSKDSSVTEGLFSTANKTLTLSQNDGPAVAIDLSALVTQAAVTGQVTSSAYDATTNILTLGFGTGLTFGVDLNALIADIIASALGTSSVNTVTGAPGSAITGGGAIGTNPVLGLNVATAADMFAGTATNKVITPAASGPAPFLLGPSGYMTFPRGDPANTFMLQWGSMTANANAVTPVVFGTSFGSGGACYAVILSGAANTDTSSQDNNPEVLQGSTTVNGFAAFNARGHAVGCFYIALGKVNLA